LFDHGANIISSDQHSTDPEGGTFFMRMAFTGHEPLDALATAFGAEIAPRFGMDWRLEDAGRLKRVAILVSREDHCLLDLLWWWRRGEVDADIGLVISNHPDHADAVASFGVPYEHVPVDPRAKHEAEARMLELLAGRFDLIVLARYMRILQRRLPRACGCAADQHPPLVPACVRAHPYRQAYERGVKITGATAHYVTEGLDAGPIIEQDVAHVTHRDDVAALTRIGRDIERTVLSRAVARHLEDRVLVHE